MGDRGTNVAAQDAPAAKGRFIAGDPLRGLACLVIVFWHVAVSSAQITGTPGVSPGMRAELGAAGPWVVSMWISVWFFFVLSGYLISGPFVRAVVRGDGRRPSGTRYAVNRVLRILPGYWFWLLVTLVVVGGATFEEVLRFLTFTHVYDQGPFTESMVQAWTLDVEVVFYALVPLLLLPLAAFLRGRLTPWGRAGVILAGLTVVSAASMSMGQLGPSSGDIVAGSAWAFAPGIALATVEPLVRPHVQGRSWGPVAALGILAVAVGGYMVHVYAEMGNRYQLLFSAIACGALLAAPLLLQWATGRSWSALDRGWLHWLGVRSYGIYLSHVLLISELRFITRGIESVALAVAVVFPLTFAGACVLGALSYRYVELPFLERRMPWRRGATAAAPATQGTPAPAAAGTRPAG